jgi:hypothetical protein
MTEHPFHFISKVKSIKGRIGLKKTTRNLVNFENISFNNGDLSSRRAISWRNCNQNNWIVFVSLQTVWMCVFYSLTFCLFHEVDLDPRSVFVVIPFV